MILECIAGKFNYENPISLIDPFWCDKIHIYFLELGCYRKYESEFG